MSKRLFDFGLILCRPNLGYVVLQLRDRPYSREISQFQWIGFRHVLRKVHNGFAEIFRSWVSNTARKYAARSVGDAENT